ncbi:MAG: energy transducer TonB [Myxococcales bacterium]
MTVQQDPVFSAILDRPSNWRDMGVSTIGVATVYVIALLGAIVLSKQPPPPVKEVPKKLTVTLFDAPKVAEFRSLGLAGGEDRGAIGAGESSAPVIKAPEPEAARVVAPTKSKKPVSAKAIPEDKPTATMGASVQPEVPKPTPATGGESVATAAPQAMPKAENTTPGAGTAGAGTGGVSGGSGGAGAGTNSGASGVAGGTGAGSRPGIVSGDTTVLPFMDGMTRPNLLSKVDPEYTKEARDANVSGLFISKCVIGTDGGLKRCKMVKGNPMMDQAVLNALSKWKYTPVVYQGKPVSVEYIIQVRLAAH